MNNRVQEIKDAIAETFKNRHTVNRRYCRTALSDVREYIAHVRLIQSKLTIIKP
jgi:hypothetical protein